MRKFTTLERECEAKSASLLTPHNLTFFVFIKIVMKNCSLYPREQKSPALATLRDGDRIVASHENAFIARHGVARVYCTRSKREQSAVRTRLRFPSGSNVAPAVPSLGIIIKASGGRVVTGFYWMDLDFAAFEELSGIVWKVFFCVVIYYRIFFFN